MNIILKKPIVTEKSMKLTEQGLYTFLVDKNAQKLQIAKAVAKKFNAQVLSVKTINVKGQRKMQRRVRSYFVTSGFKKAIVELKKGQKIAIFETPKEQEEAVVATGGGEPIVMKEKKDILRRTKVKIEKGPARPAGGAPGAAPTTQRKVITGK